MRDITELPHDIFLLVISFLAPRLCVRCRAVNRRWRAAFTTQAGSLLLLRWNFPRCRELRLAAAATAATTLPSWPTLSRNLKAELVEAAEQPRDWSSTFADVARRYFHLNKGQARVVEKLELAHSQGGSVFSFYGVAPWNRFLRLNEKTSNFHYPDPVWWYSQEDGVLVYPSATDPIHYVPSDRCDGHVYHLVDLATSQRVPVPFDVRSKHIRRLRLAQGVLIFEWAEALPYHQLNDREVVHRHFVTAFDVVRQPSSTAPGRTWAVEFRSEWKLHFLGLPLNRSDRFFSAHTATHYAVYFWQPNRSLYQDDPIEQLAVWDISTPSSYRPSEDPTGGKRPVVARAPLVPTGLWGGQNNGTPGGIYALADSSRDLEIPKRASLAVATAGPQVIRRMAWRELDFYGLRQRATPRLRALALDGQNLYVIEEEHRWADGQHSSLSPPRVHLVQSTAIPVIPTPTSSAQTARPAAARSDTNLSSRAGLDDAGPAALSHIIDGPVNGPVWVDSCGADGDIHMNFCRRVADANATAQPSISQESGRSPPLGANQGHLGRKSQPPSSQDSAGWPWVLGRSGSPSPVFATESTRWPGWAPCWRHEEFPYLTVAEMVDFAAGVRITARRCFMLETVSVHMRPVVAVKGATPVTEGQDGGGTRRRSSNAKAVSTRSNQVYFPDEMWSELVGKGHIAGDERWVVGEDEKGRITVVRF
jgi:hypothetical protein